jgi:hypothetical protein
MNAILTGIIFAVVLSAGILAARHLVVDILNGNDSRMKSFKR